MKKTQKYLKAVEKKILQKFGTNTYVINDVKYSKIEHNAIKIRIKHFCNVEAKMLSQIVEELDDISWKKDKYKTNGVISWRVSINDGELTIVVL